MDDDQKRFTVYVLQFPNGKQYVGITSQVPEKRWRRGTGYSKDSIVRKAIDHYGWDNVTKIIAYTGLTESEAVYRERELIADLNLMDRQHGYNLTSGGEMILGCRYSQETRKKLSAMRKGQQAGERNPMYGKHHAEESRKLMSKRKKGKRSSFYGKHLSEESKQKQRDNHVGRFTGADNPHAKAVMCVETGEIFPTLTEAARKTGVYPCSISMAINGAYKTAGKLHWKTMKEEGTNNT